MVDEALLARAADLKRQLLDFAGQPQWRRDFDEVVAARPTAAANENTFIMVLDYFLLEYRLRNGHTLIEQFLRAHNRSLTDADRELLLGWHDVVEQPFEVQGRDGPALLMTGLVDDLAYRVRSNAGTQVLDALKPRSFVVTRLVPIEDEWMLSGSQAMLREKEACEMAYSLSVDFPKIVYRNPEKLATGWELQRTDRERFIRFFGSDMVVVPGVEAQDRIDEFSEFRHKEVLSELPADKERETRKSAVKLHLPEEFAETETVAFIYDDTDGLGFYTEFGLVEAVFDNPELLRDRAHRNRLLGYLDDETVEPSVLLRLADRDHVRATQVFRRALNKPKFDWPRDGERLLRRRKAEYFESERYPKFTTIDDRLAPYARAD